jgi:hypothetical protein
VPAWEALVPLFDYSRVPVAYDVSGDVVVILEWIVQIKSSVRVTGELCSVATRRNKQALSEEAVATAELTGTPSGKQRQKKSGRGRPTASLTTTVRTAVMRTENRRPAWACVVCTSETSYCQALHPQNKKKMIS